MFTVEKNCLPHIILNRLFVFGVKVDQKLHAEILERNSKFKSAPYSGFVNPVLVTDTDGDGNITAIIVTQPDSYTQQMLDYANQYTTLPDVN